MSLAHPAYPTPTTERREQRAEAIANKAWANNQRIRDILSLAKDKLQAKCDLSGYSMVPGMDLKDILDQIDACMPDLHCDDRGRDLDEWAMTQAEEG